MFLKTWITQIWRGWYSAEKTFALLISCRMICIWESHFWKRVNVVTNGRMWILVKFEWKVWDGEWISQKSEKPIAGRGSPSHVLHPWPLAMPRNLNKTPMFWSQASHSLYDSNLGGTWASESIISGWGFIFLSLKKMWLQEWLLHC